MKIDLRALRQKHRAIIRASDAAIAEEMTAAAQYAEAHVEKFPRRYKHRTGNLYRSTEARVVRVRGGSGAAIAGRRVRVANTAPYAPFVEFGTRPHVIRARRVRFLRFWWKGAIRFFRKVNHPGTRHTRFLWRATYAAFRVVGPNIETRLERIAARKW